MNRPPLSIRQEETLAHIRAFIAAHGFSPSYRDIGRVMNIKTPNGVRIHIAALVRKGYLKQHPGHARTLAIVKESVQC